MQAHNDDDDDYGIAGGKDYKVPDKDFYRKMMTTFNTVNNSLTNRITDRCTRDRPMLQPHYSSLRYIVTIIIIRIIVIILFFSETCRRLIIIFLHLLMVYVHTF